MSRHIQTVDPESRKLDNLSEKGKLILTNIKDRAAAFLLQKDILISVRTIDSNPPVQIGEIYIGKVKNIVSNIDSCFVEIQNGQTCYLSMKDARSAYVLNRKISTQNVTARPGNPENISLHNQENIRLVQGDELPVQIIREAIKTKPAAVSTSLELSSEYFIFRSGSTGMGISNKLTKSVAAHIIDLFHEKGFLRSKQVIQAEGIPTFGAIARTKCQKLDDEALIIEYQKQRDAFLDLYDKARFRTCYSCILEGEAPVLTAVKDFPAEYDEIITDIPEFYDILNKEKGIPSVRFYEDSFSLAGLYSLHTKLDNAFAEKVWLKSGANLVIEQTECLTAIDINTGKNIKDKVSEDTIFQVNKEAAREIAIQIRLRNLSGIIIIDFINMKSKEQEEELLNYLRKLTCEDPVPTKVVDMTPLGLVELTRKKVNMSLKEQFK